MIKLKIFMPIPAKDTIISLALPFLKLNGLTGTGFAQPKPANKNNKKPNRSKCAKGFRVKRPDNLAVSSPCQVAAQA